MPRGKYDRTPEFRRREAAARRKAAQKLRATDRRTAELMYRLLEERGLHNASAKECGAALALIDRVLSFSDLPAGMRASLEKRRDALEAGRRIKHQVAPAVVRVGDEVGQFASASELNARLV